MSAITIDFYLIILIKKTKCTNKCISVLSLKHFFTKDDYKQEDVLK